MIISAVMYVMLGISGLLGTLIAWDEFSALREIEPKNTGSSKG